VDVKRLTKTATALAASAFFALPAAPGMAQACVPQSDVAALDQYCDSLPTSDGHPAPIGAHPGDAAPPLSATLSPREVRKLRDAGPAASALLLLPTIAPVGHGERSRRALRDAENVVASGDLDAPAGRPTTAVAKLATESPDVLGGAFRWGLVASTLGLSAMAWLRFRARLKL
jgi:hypothetical protein